MYYQITIQKCMKPTEVIVNKIKESGFHVSLSNETTLTKEMAEQLYDNQRDKEYFDDLVSMMTRQVFKRSLELRQFHCSIKF